MSKQDRIIHGVLMVLTAIIILTFTLIIGYELGIRDVQREAVEHGKAHYSPSETPANFRWNDP